METQIQNRTDSKLKEFFVDQLEDLLWAEKKLVKTLPKMQDAATSPELKNAFGNHLSQTQNHVSRLEQVFGIIGEDVDTTKCPAMAGIVDEGEDIIDDTEEGTAQRDVGLIFAGQKAEHYEIATYGGMVTLAKTLGYNDAADILGQTLAEEKEADALLTQIAENNVNYQASTEPKKEGFFS
jgi:ferritin-like metal-binding protein YciE